MKSSETLSDRLSNSVIRYNEGSVLACIPEDNKDAKQIVQEVIKSFGIKADEGGLTKVNGYFHFFLKKDIFVVDRV